jgi:hypothetical protein
LGNYRSRSSPTNFAEEPNNSIRSPTFWIFEGHWITLIAKKELIFGHKNLSQIKRNPRIQKRADLKNEKHDRDYALIKTACQNRATK